MILHILIAMVAGWIQRHQQQIITYLQEENRVLKAQLGGRRLRLTDTERRRLAALAHPLGRTRLKAMATIAAPDTLMRWYKRLIAQKFDGEPAPQRRQAGMSWAQFLNLHWEGLVATDFFTMEVATWHGLVTYYVLVVMELATRRVHIAGITPHPMDAFMVQCARQLTDPFEGFLLDKRYLIHDRDTKFTQAFDGLLKESGVEPIVLPPRSPNLNAHCERFVRSIKEETLDQMVMLGEGSLSYAIHQYLSHYHAERNNQGLANQLIVPELDLGSHSGQVRRRERLDGLLSYYYRDAA